MQNMKKIYMLSRINGIILEGWVAGLLICGCGFMLGYRVDIFMYIGVVVMILSVPVVIAYGAIEKYIYSHVCNYDYFIVSRLAHGLTRQAKEAIAYEDAKRKKEQTQDIQE